MSPTHLILIAAAALGCQYEIHGTLPPGAGGAGTDGGLGGSTAGSGTGGSGTAGGAGASLGGGGAGGAVAGPSYCEVQTLLANRCVSCHASPPLRSVPMPLLGASDLLAEAPNYPGRSAADVSIERMRDTTAPMPPAPAAAATSEEVAILESWLEAGAPAACSAGGGGTGGVVGNPYDTPITCTSQSAWTGGDRESPNMHPGGACITCHEDEGPTFAIAGTVYPTAHETDDCNGSDGRNESINVVIVDGKGVTHTVGVNSVGNFFIEEDSIAFPYRAKVVAGGRERVMATAQKSGDCNQCHTVSGAEDAPGRIMAP